MSPWLWVPLLVAFVVTTAMLPWVMRTARAWGVAQPPLRERDIHRGTIPRMGGLAMVIGFVVAVIVAALLPVPRTDQGEGLRLFGLLLGSGLAGLLGLADDRRDLGPWTQTLMQLALGTVALLTTIWIRDVNSPFGPGLLWDAEQGFPMLLVIPITLFWFMGSINTINFIDGLDGLAAGVACIASVVFALHMLSLGQLSVALLPLALVGATLAFLRVNFFPAQTFMGSTGAYFLGYALAALSIIAGAKIASLLLVLAVPILDAAWLIFSRVRRGQNPMRGSRDHLHHRLYDVGLSQRQVVLGYWAITTVTGMLSLVLPGRRSKLVVLLLLAVLALVLFWSLARRAEPAGTRNEKR